MTELLGFGKHETRTLEWLFFNDPGYVWWMIGAGAASRLSGPTRARFDALVRRAMHLRIPGKCAHCTKGVERMSLTRHVSGGLARVGFFCGSCHHDGGSSYLMTPAFYTSDFFRSYDKTGGTILVHEIKHRYFGSKPPRMTQAAMAKFFDTPENFVNF
jgi:hypothetical protein